MNPISKLLKTYFIQDGFYPLENLEQQEDFKHRDKLLKLADDYTEENYQEARLLLVQELLFEGQEK